MQIDKILKLKNGMYEVIVKDDSNELKFKLSEEIMIKNQIYSKKMITKDELKQFEELSSESKLYSATLNYISYKMRTEYEVRTYLEDKGCPNELLMEIISKLKRLNYINDEIYSLNYTKYQFEINKKGPNLIKQELIKKEVDISIIENSLKQLTYELMIETIQSLIQYYSKMNKNKSLYKLKENILHHLISKGFDYQISFEQVNNFNFGNDKDEEEILNHNLRKTYQKWVKKYKGQELKSRVIKTLLNKGFNYENILNAFDSLELEG